MRKSTISLPPKQWDPHRLHRELKWIATAIIVMLSYSTADAAQVMTGAKIEDFSAITPLPVSSSITGIALPSKVDFSTTLPDIGDQRSFNSCVGWATAYYLKTSQEEQERRWGPKPDNHKFSPLFIYNAINGGQDNGSSIIDALNRLKNVGCDTVAGFNPDNITTQPDAASIARAAAYKIGGWDRLPRDVNTMKLILAQGRPILVATKVFPDFILSFLNPVYDNMDGIAPNLGHVVCIVGYDDALQAFKFANSGGSEYGENGFGLITYRFFGVAPTPVYGIFTTYDQIATPGLIGYWRCNEGSGDNLWDYSTFGSHFRSLGTSYVGGHSLFGLSTQFNAGSYATLDVGATARSPSSLFDLPGGKSMTISMWIKQTNTTTGFLFGKGANNTGQLNYALISRQATATHSYLDFGYYDTVSGATQLYRTSTALIPLNTWLHVAAVRTMPSVNGGAHAVGLYVNGEKKPGFWAYGNGTTTPRVNSYKPVLGNFLGDRQGFNGVLDEVKIFNRVLSDAEILAERSQPPFSGG